MSIDVGAFRAREGFGEFELTLLAERINHRGEWRVDLSQLVLVEDGVVEEMRQVFLSPEVMDGLCDWWAERRPTEDPPS